MKNFIKNHTGLFIAIVAVLGICLFYLYCYMSWAFFINGTYIFRKENYNVQMFGAYTMTDSSGVKHTGMLRPKDYSVFNNDGMYMLTDDTTGKTYEVIKTSETNTKTRQTTYYLSFKCPICDNAYLSADQHDKINAKPLEDYGVCLDCITSKNKYITTMHDQSIFNESEHPTDGKCDICGTEAMYKDEYEEYCAEHIDNLRKTVKDVIPHWVDLDEIDISDYPGTNMCFQIGTHDMRESGVSFEIYDPSEGGIKYYSYRVGYAVPFWEKAVDSSNDLAAILGGETGKINIKFDQNAVCDDLILNVKVSGGIRAIKLKKGETPADDQVVWRCPNCKEYIPKGQNCPKCGKIYK